MKTIQITLTGLILLLLSACQSNAIAPYDKNVRNQLVRNSVQVDYFWQRMQATPVEARTYSLYASDYKEIALELKILLKLNQMRANNDESIQQSQTLLDLWLQDIARHEKNNTFKDILVKRRISEYQRVFDAMLTAEYAKDI